MSLARVISEMLNQTHQGRGGQSRMMGAMIAEVTNNVDPERRYRVKVKYPWLHDSEESFWARISSGMSGSEMGQFWLPEVGDEVLVVFQEGDFERPILVGNMWNGVDQSPRCIVYSPCQTKDKVPNKCQGGKNDFRFMRSRMGHHLMFKDRPGEGSVSLRSKLSHELYLDDTKGAEKIRLYDKDQKQWLEIDVPGKIIKMETQTGDILIKAKKTITLDCKDLVITAKKTIKVKSGTSSEWKADTKLTWQSGCASCYKAGGTMTLKAPKIDLNP